ncbi:MAG TPA: peptidylprolyl isomerase [Polyangiaceae bacterium]|nr:peptidylprolyl isomerase [Polyangiaceae bacterium]
MSVSTRAKHLLQLELTRDTSAIGAAELSSRDLAVRRAAARALARNAVESSRDWYKRALSDEDHEVVAWGAFGLGRICSASVADATLHTLQGRAATLLLSAEPTEVARARTELDPWHAIAQAIGRCASTEAERILRSWIGVSPALARVATLGLDSYVQATKTLDDSTVVLLLDTAENERGLASALLPISRLPRVDSLVARRILNVAPKILDSAGVERRFLLRTLPLASQAALPLLERIAVDDSRYQPLERVEAVRAIAKLGIDGQRVLLRLALRLIPADAATSEALLLSPRWSIVVELLEQLAAVPLNNRARFAQLAQVEVPEGKGQAVRRRIAQLRCRSAALASDNDALSPLIKHCDPRNEQRPSKLAQLSVLNRQRNVTKQAALVRELTSDPDPVVRMAALDTWSAHPELRDSLEPIHAALAANSPGVVTKAARWIADNVSQSAWTPTTLAELGAAVEAALRKPWKPDAIEVRVSLIDAAAQLGVLTLKPKILEECASGAPWVRQHAERALRGLGEPNQSCPAPAKHSPVAELDHLQSAPVVLRFHTDVGGLEMRLEPQLAPAAVTRLVDLARAGFYEGVAVHRAVPGFVVQLGDRQGDGYGGSGSPPLACELAPQPFAPLDVGMALSGPDSASSQFFVTLGPYPQLGGEYTRVGSAGPGWETLTIGDVIQRVEIIP